MTTAPAAPVPLGMIAAQAGVQMPQVIAHADAVKASVVERWDGALVVPDRVAKAILERIRAEEIENAQLNAAYLAWLGRQL